REGDPLLERGATQPVPRDGASMMSYLQRLALGAMQPAKSIHPMVGSMFSPLQHGTAYQTLPAEESGFSHTRFKSRRELAPGEENDASLGDKGFHHPKPVYLPLMANVQARPAAVPSLHGVDRQVQPNVEEANSEHGVGPFAKLCGQDTVRRQLYTPL